MKKSLLLFVLLAVSACAFAQSALPAAADHVHFARVYNPHTAAPPPGVTMTYYGGPIMFGDSNSIYIIYYGNWTTGPLIWGTNQAPGFPPDTRYLCSFGIW